MDLERIGILGGTGPAGRALAGRLAAAGWEVLLGSRDPVRATAVTEDLERRWGPGMKRIVASTNEDAAELGQLVVLGTAAEAAVPTASQHASAIAGKVVVSMANAMKRTGGEFRPMAVAGGSVALAVQAAAPKALVSATLHHVPAGALAALDRDLEGDVIVVANDERAKQETMALLGALKNLRPFDGGSLANAAGLEMFCANILTVNLLNATRVTLRLDPA